MNHSSPAWKGLGGVGLIVDGGSVLKIRSARRHVYSVSCSRAAPKVCLQLDV